MILMKLEVNPKGYDTEDGYDLICTDWQIGTVVEAAIRNDYKDIRISEPSPIEKINYRKGLGIDDDTDIAL